MYLPIDQRSVCPPAPSFTPYNIESILEQGSGELNEDVLLDSDNLYGVFDGATSLDKRRFYDNISGGLLAARTAADTFSKNDSEFSLSHLADMANNRIRKALTANNIATSDRHHFWSTSLAVVRLIEGQIEYCQTGDAHILLIYRDGSHHLVTPDIDIDRETLQLWKQTVTAPEATIHNVLAEQIQKVRLQMNKRYGVLNGEPAAMKFLCHGYHDTTDVQDILLFTDGLFLPKENPLEANEWSSFVDLYLAGGLHAVQRHVRSLQKTDPACRKYPRFKQHDDIAALAIQL